MKLDKMCKAFLSCLAIVLTVVVLAVPAFAVNTITITVTNTIQGDEANMEDTFEFKVDIDDHQSEPGYSTAQYPYYIDGVYAGYFENGSSPVTLGHDQTLTIPDLPEGTSYSFIEDPIGSISQQEYDTSDSTLNGEPYDGGWITSSNTDETIIFVNTRGNTLTTRGSTKNGAAIFPFTKTITGSDYGPEATFDFDIRPATVQPGTTFTDNGTGGTGQAFNVKSGIQGATAQSITFTNSDKRFNGGLTKTANIDFSSVSFTEEGLYCYDFCELSDGKNCFVYDTKHYFVYVNVVSDGMGGFVPGEIFATKVNSNNRTEVVFRNTFRTGDLSVTKIIQGTDANMEDQFLFSIDIQSSDVLSSDTSFPYYINGEQQGIIYVDYPVEDILLGENDELSIPGLPVDTVCRVGEEITGTISGQDYQSFAKINDDQPFESGSDAVIDVAGTTVHFYNTLGTLERVESLTFTKTIPASDDYYADYYGPYAPKARFEFDIEPQNVAPGTIFVDDGKGDPHGTGRTFNVKSGIPGATVDSITFTNNDSAINGAFTKTGNIDFSGIDFPEPGLYAYTIHEIDPNLSAISCDMGDYTVYVNVAEDPSGNCIPVDIFTTFPDHKERFPLVFRNSFYTTQLWVTKTIEGNAANAANIELESFEFEVCIDPNEVLESGTQLKYRFLTSGNDAYGNDAGTISVGEPTLFYLSHDSTLVIYGVPLDTTFYVKENPVGRWSNIAYEEPQATLFVGDNLDFVLNFDGQFGDTLTIPQWDVYDPEPKVIARFVNSLNTATPTGLTKEKAPLYALLACLPISGGAAVLILRHRFSRSA